MRIHCLLSPSCTGSRRSICMSSPFGGWRVAKEPARAQTFVRCCLPAGTAYRPLQQTMLLSLAVQQPLGGRWVVGGQHDKARLLVLQRENLAGALGEPPPVADPGELAAL